MSLSCAAGSKLMPCDLLLRQYTVELSDCILTRIDLCRIDPRSVKDWPDVTGRSVTDWLEVWRIDQKLQTWHGKHRPEVIDQKCEGLTRSVKDWPGLTRSMCLKHVCTLYILHEMCLLFEMCLKHVCTLFILHEMCFWFEMCLKHVLSGALCLCLRSVAMIVCKDLRCLVLYHTLIFFVLFSHAMV